MALAGRRHFAGLWLVSGSTLFAATAGFAQERLTSGVANGVSIRGVEQRSSAGVPHDPRFELVNRSSAVHRVSLVTLESLAVGGGHRTLSPAGARAWTLAAGAHRAIAIEYSGEALQAGRGLPWHRFRATFDVDGVRTTAIAINAYVERIPARGEATE